MSYTVPIPPPDSLPRLLADADQALTDAGRALRAMTLVPTGPVCAFCRVPAFEEYPARRGGTFATCAPCGRSHRHAVAGEKAAALVLDALPELAEQISLASLALIIAGALDQVIGGAL